MDRRVSDVHGVCVVEIEPDGPILRTSRDATDLIGEALGQQATMVVLPLSRLGEEFFDLSTRIAGEFVQKFVNYGVRLAVVGDIARYVAASTALRDFVREANCGSQIWFVRDLTELEAQLQAIGRN